MTSVVLENLSHVYNPGSVFEKAALQSVSLEIGAGEMVAIIGHTGSGKSTLIQHLNGLLKPTSGRVLLDGRDIHADKSMLGSVRQRVGLVFQYPEHQLFESTIYKDVAYGPTRMGLSESEVGERVRQSLDVVGIDTSLYEKSPFEVSGGQKRRVAIAGVLAMGPEVLVLDEPAAGLDPAGKDEIFAQVRRMHDALGMTVVLVSHSMEDVASLAGRIFVMSQGQLLCEGTPAQVFAKGDMLKSVGLDVPQISQVFAALNKENPQIPAGVFTVPDAARILMDIYKGRES